jgi:lipopolysaccharide transport system ATP-binding protein
MQPAQLVLTLVGEQDGMFDCRYGILLNDHSGNCVVRIYSPPDRFTIARGETRRVEMLLNPVQLGPGEFTLGISILENSALEQLNSARRFDLLGRSFVVRVDLPETLGSVSANFMHTAEWRFGG